VANQKELRALITLAGKIDPSLQTALLKASGESLKLANNLKKAGNGMNSISTIAKGAFLGDLAARATSGMTEKLMELGKESIKLASDLNEVQNVVDTTFGSSANTINDWSKQALKAYGLSELQAKQFSGTMGAMLKSSGVAGEGMIKMSENLAALSGDFASFYNLKQEEAFEKIRSGISGETEPLKQLGINMSVANLEAFALSKGITTSYEKMDQASQTILRYNYLMSVSKDAQGDFAKTQGQYANQQRLFDTNLKQASATIAAKALPYLTQLLQKGNNFINNFDIAGAAEKAGHWFSIMGDSIKWVYDHSNILIPVLSGLAFSIAALKVVGMVNGLMDAWKASTFAMTLAQQGLNVALRENPIGLVITAIGLLVAAGVYLWQNWDTVRTKALEIWAGIKNTVVENVDYVIGKINALIDGFNRITGLNLGKINLIGTSQSSNEGSGPPEAQGYAHGGIAIRPSIFGEAGPEIAIPLERTSRSLGLLSQAAGILGVPMFRSYPMLDGGLQLSNQIDSQLNTPIINQLDLRPINPARGESKPEINITYSPNIQSGNRTEVQRALDTSFEQFKNWVEEYFEGKVRVSFG